jgi:uncharacterized SAM-dependent methyltransferase
VPDLIHVAIHPSQFPEQVRRDLLESLGSRQVNHKFHYDSIKQTQKWLALHQEYSPSRTDPDCAAIYDASFEAIARQIPNDSVHLIGLGCGGGQKDSRLLKLLHGSGKKVAYTPVDVSTAMVLTATQAASKVIPPQNCFPLVCDLATADDLPILFERPAAPNTARLFTCFGMLPNFEPGIILPRLAALIRKGNHLLVSANLAPGADYAEGVRKILPLYDNPLTRDWLMTFLLDLGVETGDGELRFSVEDDAHGSGLKRIIAFFSFQNARKIQIDSDRFIFEPGQSIRLFFSYRHSPVLLARLLKDHGLEIEREWITKSEEEGVFLVRRVPSRT